MTKSATQASKSRRRLTDARSRWRLMDLELRAEFLEWIIATSITKECTFPPGYRLTARVPSKLTPYSTPNASVAMNPKP